MTHNKSSSESTIDEFMKQSFRGYGYYIATKEEKCPILFIDSPYYTTGAEAG